MTPQGRSPRFLCDVMLARFARYLRAAGYDAALADGHWLDRDILSLAAAEERWLLTVDRRILEHNASRGRTVMLPHGSLDAQAAELTKHFSMDWTGRSFTRCLLDNAVLDPLPAAKLEQVPQDARRPGEPLLCCPVCGRVYWRGSHWRRMSGRLQRWGGGDFGKP